MVELGKQPIALLVVALLPLFTLLDWANWFDPDGSCLGSAGEEKGRQGQEANDANRSSRQGCKFQLPMEVYIRRV